MPKKTAWRKTTERMTTNTKFEGSILRQVTLDCTNDEMIFLGYMLKGVVQANLIPNGWELETYCLIELYERQFKKFELPKAGKLKLKTSEFISLQQLIMWMPLDLNGHADLIRNQIIMELNAIKWEATDQKTKHDLEENDTSLAKRIPLGE